VAYAAWWSFVGAASLLLGAGLTYWFTIGARTLGLVMGFGAGALISAVAFDLVLPSAQTAGRLPILVGLLAGALTFWGGDLLLERRTGGQDPVVGTQVSGLRWCSGPRWTASPNRWPSV
jgi:ZIP family zinc transporter